MLEIVREYFLKLCWDNYLPSIPTFHNIFASNIKPVIDHFAIIDLSGKNCGINYLYNIFKLLGFEKVGEGYIESKQNDFIWLRLPELELTPANRAFPQIVLADFRLKQLSEQVRNIILKYSDTTAPVNLPYIEKKLQDLQNSDDAKNIAEYIYNSLCVNPWKNVSLNDYETVNVENSLLAWVLVMGRKVNHFGVNINLLNKYENLLDFHKHLYSIDNIKFNDNGGEIKGSKRVGICQSSLNGELVEIDLHNGQILINNCFLEFVWRYSKISNPYYFNDYYTDFVPTNADKVIESLYK